MVLETDKEWVMEDLLDKTTCRHLFGDAGFVFELN